MKNRKSILLYSVISVLVIAVIVLSTILFTQDNKVVVKSGNSGASFDNTTNNIQAITYDQETYKQAEEYRTVASSVEIKTSNELKSELLESDKYEKLSNKEWESKTEDRDIDHLPYERLVELVEYYPQKIQRESEVFMQLSPEEQALSLATTNETIERLKDKFILVCKEKELRDKASVKREIHHTIYYIDLDGGNDASDGLTTGNAWLTIGKYTTTTVRTAGDIAYVRANTSQTIGAITNCDEDGTFNSPISIIGCDSVTNDPWGDASDVKPIIDFNNGSYYLNITQDDYWHLERLEFYNSAYSNGALVINIAKGIKIVSCDINTNTTQGLYLSTYVGVILESCTFDSNGTRSVMMGYGALAEFYDCTFDGGSGTTTGIYVNQRFCLVYLYNCSFGQSSAHTNYDIDVESSIVYGQNCIFQKAAIEIDAAMGGFAFFEDWQQTKGSHYSISRYATIIDDSAIQIDSLDSIKISPTANANALQWGSHQYGTYKLWLTAGSYTISIKARETAAWANDPDSEAFFFRASYLNHAANATRTFADSSQALSGTSEITFTMAVSPAQDGWVYVTPYLLAYESGKSVNISIKPSVS